MEGVPYKQLATEWIGHFFWGWYYSGSLRSLLKAGLRFNNRTLHQLCWVKTHALGLMPCFNFSHNSTCIGSSAGRGWQLLAKSASSCSSSSIFLQIKVHWWELTCTLFTTSAHSLKSIYTSFPDNFLCLIFQVYFSDSLKKNRLSSSQLSMSPWLVHYLKLCLLEGFILLWIF